jgi:hypothetical protein
MPAYNQPENFDIVASVKDLQKRVRFLETVPDPGAVLQMSTSPSGSGTLAGSQTYIPSFNLITGLYLYPKRQYAFVGAMVLNCSVATDVVNVGIWQQLGASPNTGSDNLLSFVGFCTGTTSTVGPLPFFNRATAGISVQNATLYLAANRTGAGTDTIFASNGGSSSWWGIMDVGVA